MSYARDRQLDGLRTVAVSMVLYHHFFAVNGSVLGHLGVRLFFVLSGFLITRLLLDARFSVGFQSGAALKAFYVRRALRIFPPYFAMLGFIWFVNLEGARGNLKWHALYLSNFWYALRNEWTPWVLCHTWSLSIEEQFYIAWPLVMFLAPRRLIAPISVAVLALSLAYRFYWPFTGTPALARDLLPPASVDALVAGSLLAVHRRRTESWPAWIGLSVVPLTIAAMTALWLKSVPMTPVLEWLTWIGAEVFPLLPLVVLVGCCSSGVRGAFGRILEQRSMTAIGRMSYGVYLFHPVVLSLVVKAQSSIPINVSEQGPGRFVIATTATLMLASISWLAFEKPLNKLKRYFPYVSSARTDVLPSTRPNKAAGREYDASAYQPSYANRDEHGS